MHNDSCNSCNRFWREVLRRLLCCGEERKVVRIATYSFKGISFTAKGDGIMLSVKDTDVPGTVVVTINGFTDAKGKPAKVDGAPTNWVASNPSLIDLVTPAADGMSATLHLTDNPDASLISFDVDIDLGGGVSTKTFSDTVTVTAGDAAGVDLSFGTVTPDAGGGAPGPT